jgi:hypothetical protein
MTFRIESKAKLIWTRIQPITSGYRYSSKNGGKTPLLECRDALKPHLRAPAARDTFYAF